MKVSDLPDWQKNPRKITPSKARILAKTLQEFGDLSGFVFNKQNDSLVSGHQRKSILENAEIQITEKYDTPTAQGTTAIGYAVIDGEKFAYREVMWDEDKHTAAAIAANKGAGEWDFATLKDLMLEMDSGAFDMEFTGFELPEIENMMGAVTIPDLENENVEKEKKFILTLEFGTQTDMEAMFKEMANRGVLVKVKS